MRIVIRFPVMARCSIRGMWIMLLGRREDGGVSWVGSRNGLR